MLNIFELSNYELYRLQSIDPYLDDNWRDTLYDILPKLDKDSQKNIFQQILVPRGVVYDNLTKKFFVKPQLSLAETLKTITCTNDKISSIANHMLVFLETTIFEESFIELADKIEAMLAYYDKIPLDENLNEHISAKKIRRAFLYNLVKWIEKVDIEFNPGMRNLTADMIRSYFKSVFIKQQIQLWEFRSWDGQDIETLSSSHFPDFLKHEARIRRFLVVETPIYWFLVGQTHLANQNPFSFRRFLFEDRDKSGKYIYLTHVVVTRSEVSAAEVKSNIVKQLSRFYTLDRSVSEEVKIFINSSRDLLNRYLYPLLKKPLAPDGRDIDEIIDERMHNFEKQLTVLILNKLPRILTIAYAEQSDIEFLYFHLDWLLKNISNVMDDFCLQPLANFSSIPKIMSLRILAMRVVLKKTKARLSQGMTISLRYDNEPLRPLQHIKNLLEQAENQAAEIDSYRLELTNHDAPETKRGLFKKIIPKKQATYSYTELNDYAEQLNLDCYMAISQIVKDNREFVIQLEFDCNVIIDEQYRHFALPDGEGGLTRLPKLISLPNHRENFEFTSLQKIINFDVFKTNQEWL